MLHQKWKFKRAQTPAYFILTAKFPGPVDFSFYRIGIIPVLMAKKLVLDIYHDNF
jgi:hypothetical protein